MRRLVSILVTVLLSMTATAQLLQPDYSVPSPQAASLGEYGEVPVSHFTGTPDVSVPLFELEAGDFKYPFGLSYHLASVKPHAQPGPVGLGWLLTDACISRTVRGVYDEKMDEGGFAHGYYGHYAKMRNITGNLFDSYTQNSLMGDNWFELSADEFSFSMNGHSGRFYLNPTGDWTVVSDEDIVVEFDASEGFLGLQELSTRIPEVLWWSNRGNNVRWFKAFTLITPDGVRYEFGGLDAMDFSISYYNRDESDLIATSWHLSRIITPEGREIDFEYQTDQLLCDLRYTTGHTISYGFPSGNPEFLRQSIHGRSGLSGSLLFPASLSRIISPADTLNVTYYEDRSYSHLYSQYYADVLYWETPEDHPVNLYSYEWSFQTGQFFELLPITGAQTQVESRQAIAGCLHHDLVHRISLKPRYGGIGGSWYMEYGGLSRTKLLDMYFRIGVPALQYEYDEGGGVVYPSLVTPADTSGTSSLPEWHFRYDVNRVMPRGYLLSATDPWGYWKGGTLSMSRPHVPRKNDAAPLQYAKAETLKEICYPTGGRVQFEYEQNAYGKIEGPGHGCIVSETGIGGGLRVKRITLLDRSRSIGSIVRYHYSETPNSATSSGIATSLPPSSVVYMLSASESMHVDSSEGFPVSATNQNTPPVGYSTVIEERQDLDGNTLGYVRYRYSNFDADINGTLHLDEPFTHSYNCGEETFGTPYTSNSSERGKLLEKEILDSGFSPVRRERIRYARIEEDSLYVANQRIVVMCPDPDFYVSASIGWISKLRVYSYLPVERTMTDYVSNGSVSHTETVLYGPHKLPFERVSSRSDGETVIHRKSFTGDSDLYHWMASRHLLDYPVAVRTMIGSLSRVDSVYYSSVLSGSGVPVPYPSGASTGYAENRKQLYEILSADAWGNATYMEADGMRSRLKWICEGQRLDSVAENADADETPGVFHGGLSVPDGLVFDVNGFSGTLETVYYYDGNLRPVLVSDPNYHAERYRYDGLGRLSGKGESDLSDGWGSVSEKERWEYAFSHSDIRRPLERFPLSPEQQSHIFSEEDTGEDCIPDCSLETGYTTRAQLEYRNELYQELHPSHLLLLNVRDTVLSEISVEDFSYWQEVMDTLSFPSREVVLQLDVYRTGLMESSLVCSLPFVADMRTMEVHVLPEFGGGSRYPFTFVPGSYRIEFGPLDPDMYIAQRSVGKKNIRHHGRGSENPDVPEEPEEPLEMISPYPALTLRIDCLPLQEDDPEEDIEEDEDSDAIASWNSIRHWSSRDGTSVNGSVTVDWYDDFGREEVSVAAGANPDGKDLVSAMERDGWGREIAQWLPSVSEPSDSLAYRNPGLDSVKIIAGQTYGMSERPYSLTEYERSPLSRVTGQYGPGTAWQDGGKKVSTDYLTNTASGAELSCRRFVCTASAGGTSWMVTSSGYYAAGKLYVTRTTDEDGRQSLEFKDFDGNVVLSRTRLSVNQYLDTYYVYDVFGNLEAVLPPLASAALSGVAIPQDALDDYAYLYTYDDRDRCIVKKLPGAEPVYYVYDEADRAILTQDGNSRARGEASFTLYDVFGRVTVTGICRNTVTPGDRLRTYAKATYVGSSGALKGYDVDGITLASPEVLTASWYDTHSFTGDVLALTLAGGDTTLVYGTPTSVSYGLQTGSWSAVLGNRASGEPTGTWSIIRYDRRNRVAKTVSSTHTGGRTIEDVEYTFRGSPLRRHIVHTDARDSSFFEDYRYSYDHEERLLNAIHSLNGTDSLAVVSNTYDSLGRLSSNSRTDNPQLTTQYSYNIRSWTTGISSPYFTETLYYNAARPGSGTGIQWGGNISSMEWDGTKAYDYAYDGLSRLTRAVYAGGASNSRQYTYDGHGNITGLTEGTTPHSYTYIGNHLSSSQYDANGNMTADAGTGIASVRYNVLNLPEEIIKSNGDTVRYTYSAAGAKLRESVIPVSGSPVHTDYVGNLVYRDGLLGRILVEGGAIAAKDSTLVPAYEFAFTDHLGNVRALVRAGEVRYRKTEYGPYGEVLSEDWTSQPVSPGGGGDGGDELIEVGDDEEDPGSRGGMLHAGVRSNGIIQTVMDSPYRFGGKERLDESGLALYDFGARHYTTTLPRWLTMDPLAEKYYGVSPYVYCAGNPVVLVDPNGMDWYRNDNDEYIWRDTNEGEITENDVMYKNVGTSATFALDDGSYGIHYQNMRVARANVPISFESLVEQNPGIVGRLLGTQSSLSEEAKEALMQDCIRTGQAVFLNAPETRFIVGALMTVLFLPEDVVSILDMPKKAFHLLRIEEKEGLRIEEILKDFVLEKKSKGKRIGYVEGRVLESDFKNLAKQYGKSYVNKRGVEMIDVPTGSITRHISTQTGKPTLNIPVEGRIYKIRYDR